MSKEMHLTCGRSLAEGRGEGEAEPARWRREGEALRLRLWPPLPLLSPRCLSFSLTIPVLYVSPSPLPKLPSSALFLCSALRRRCSAVLLPMLSSMRSSSLRAHLSRVSLSAAAAAVPPRPSPLVLSRSFHPPPVSLLRPSTSFLSAPFLSPPSDATLHQPQHRISRSMASAIDLVTTDTAPQPTTCHRPSSICLSAHLPYVPCAVYHLCGYLCLSPRPRRVGCRT